MTNELSLSAIRSALTRLEETILFGLIERAQFKQNAIIYRKGEAWPGLEGESLVGFLLHECERSHAKVRRYTSPDEHPFFHDLPQPILPPLEYDNPLRVGSKELNINDRIRQVYEMEIIPHICEEGDDRQWGSSSVCDVSNLQNISKRVHYGKFVAESKFRAQRDRLKPVINAGDRDELWKAITDVEIERQVLQRVYRKAKTYVAELNADGHTCSVKPEIVQDIYARWIMPLNKEVQVEYLLRYCSD